ncbi:MAG: hypothetical protein ACJ795_18185, partial [Ktedonobacteraceae bacterium]
MVDSAYEPGSPPISDSQPALTLQQVRDGWEKVKKRVRGRNKAGPRTAAYLNDYAIISVEGSSDETIVAMQAAHLPHYTYLRENAEYCADVEWALKLEFNQRCRIRLVAPGQSAPALPAHTSNNQASYSAPLTTPQQPVRRERPAAPPAAKKQQGVKQEPPAVPAPAPDVTVSSSPEEDSPEAVVKKHIVRENIPTEVPRLSPEVIKQKAGGDPVVQEVVKTFAAEIVDIRLK